MVDYQTWLAGDAPGAINAEQRAINAFKRIQRNQTLISIKRGNTNLDPQTVRIVEQSTSGNETISPPDGSNLRTVQVFGVIGHPVVADTDLKRGDIFLLGDDEPFTRYRITGVIQVPGEVQATAEVMQ